MAVAKVKSNAAASAANKEYKNLKIHKQADQGKAYYESGKTIIGNQRATEIIGIIGGLSATGIAYASSQGMLSKKATIGATAGVAGLRAVYIGKALVDTYRSKRLRAYYGHRFD